MMTVVASKPQGGRYDHEAACKPRANCLKPKETGRIDAPAAAF
jgi:hypothetical protein